MSRRGRKPRASKAISRALIGAGGAGTGPQSIRHEIWLKLWGNVSFNPISALTLATLDRVATEPGTRGVARAMMEETREIAAALDVQLRMGIERRIEGAVAVGAHRTSMLQDLEKGRAMEIDALVTSVQELGRLVGVPTPAIDIVLALVRQRARGGGTVSGVAAPETLPAFERRCTRAASRGPRNVFCCAIAIGGRKTATF